MITEVKGDLLSSDAQVLTNTVNCVGAMGAGVAKQFKQRYPGMYTCYKILCHGKLFKPGMLWSWRDPITNTIIINIATKDHWRDPSQLAWIERAVTRLAKWAILNNITSIAMPRPGCGLGGLDWRAVKPLLLKAFEPYPEIEVTVYSL